MLSIDSDEAENTVSDLDTGDFDAEECESKVESENDSKPGKTSLNQGPASHLTTRTTGTAGATYFLVLV